MVVEVQRNEPATSCLGIVHGSYSVKEVVMYKYTHTNTHAHAHTHNIHTYIFT